MDCIQLSNYCIKIGSGATPKGGASVYVEKGVSLIRSQNVYNLFFKYDGLTHITDEAAKKLNGVTVVSGDILLNITGDSVARVCMVPDEVLPARVNQHVSIIRTCKELSPQYLLYYLASPYMQSHMLNIAIGKGASRNALTKGMIENFSIPFPTLKTQHKIVSILSTYDDLIENNNRRIRLLEQMAENLYKEWFVRFRFPGHEQAEFENDIPKGWEMRKLNSIFRIKYGKDHKGLGDGQIPVFGSGGIMRFADKVLFSGETVLIPRKGSLKNVMYYNGDLWTVDTMFYTKFENNHYPLYTYFSLSQYDLESLNTGASIPSLSTDVLYKLKILLPDISVLELFNEKIAMLFSLKTELKKANENLTKQRDMLLPRLMSGKLEV